MFKVGDIVIAKELEDHPHRRWIVLASCNDTSHVLIGSLHNKYEKLLTHDYLLEVVFNKKKKSYLPSWW